MTSQSGNSFQQYFIRNLTQNFFNFKGRIRRREFWMYYLYYLIFAVIFGFIDGVIAGIRSSSVDTDMTNPMTQLTPMVTLYTVLTFFPTIGMTARRLHDVGLTGWTQLVGIFPIIGGIIMTVICALDGKPGTNKWGPNPKEAGMPNLQQPANVDPWGEKR